MLYVGAQQPEPRRNQGCKSQGPVGMLLKCTQEFGIIKTVP